MAKTYARMTKITNATGRSNYISSQEKQEYLIDHEKSRDFDWQTYSQYEKNNQKSSSKNNEARELVIALPNEMSSLSAEKRREIANELATELLGTNRDYEYALHFNASHTNFHMHLLFSEREKNKAATIKTYKRDMWYNTKTNKMAKAHAPGAELRYKKGSPMINKDGSLRFDSDPFSVKDPKFKRKAWLQDSHATIQSVLGRHGYQLDVYDPEKEIKQRKLFKGSSPEYQYYAKLWNANATKINADYQKQLAPLVADRDRFQLKISQYDRVRHKELEKKWLKGSATKAEIASLQGQLDELIVERDTLSRKYDFPKDMKITTMLEKLNELIVHLVTQFQNIKRSLSNQIGTMDRAMAFKMANERSIQRDKPTNTRPRTIERAPEGLNRRLDELKGERREIHSEQDKSQYRRSMGGFSR